MNACRKCWLVALVLALSSASFVGVGAEDRDDESAVEVGPLTLRPGDKIKITVVGYDNLKGEYLVEETGTVDLPLLGEIDVVGLTREEAEDLLTQKFGELYLTEPQVIVEGMYRVSVLGEVKQPGMYHINGTEKLSDLVALAGGPTVRASLGRARLTRDGDIYQGNLKKSISQGETVADLGVRSGDILYVPAQRSYLDWRIWTSVLSSILVVITIYDRTNN